MHDIVEEVLRTDPTFTKHHVGTEGCDMSKLKALSPAFPPSYLAFLTRYGGAKLFREGDGYLLIVLPLPQKVDGGDSGILFCFGSYDDSYCYFCSESMRINEESPVYAFEDEGLVQVARDFTDWFILASRELLSQQQPNSRENSAMIFSEEERRIVQLRKEYNWLVVGRTNAYVVIHITNESDSRLDCITIGVRSKDGTLNGAVRVDVKGLAPGMSRTIQLDCYSDLAKPDQVELFELPDPIPATKDNYFELKHL